MVKDVRLAEQSLGKVTYEIPEKIEKNRKFARSLFVVEDIKAGERITKENIKSIRPGYGLHPRYFEDVLGKKVKRDLKRGEPLNLVDLLI